MEHAMNRSIVRPMGLLTIGLFLAASFAAQAGEARRVKLSGTVIEGMNANGKHAFGLRFEDGSVFMMRNPKADFKHETYLNKKVTYTFRAEATTEDGKERLTVTTTYPIAVEELKEGQAVPPRDPNVVIPGMEKPGGG